MGKEILRVENLSSPGKFNNISFSVKAGEVLGLGGLVGAGRTEITEAIAEKMIALIDMIEGLDDNNALKELFNTQLGMNKIRGNNDET